MGEYGYYDVRTTKKRAMPLSAAVTWLQAVANKHGEGEPSLSIQELSPADAKTLKLDLHGALYARAPVDDPLAHFAKCLELANPALEHELGYTDDIERGPKTTKQGPEYERTVTFVGDKIRLRFQRSIHHPADHPANKAAAEAFFKKSAKAVGVTLDVEVVMAPEKQWPREEHVKILQTSGGTAELLMRSTVVLAVTKSRQKFEKLLKSMPDLATADLLVRGPLSAVKTEWKKLGGPKPGMIVDNDHEVKVDWPGLAKLTPKSAIHIRVNVPIKVGALETLLTLTIQGKKHRLELEHKWGLADEEQAVLETKLSVSLKHTVSI